MDTVATLKDVLVQYGAGWVLWLLFALSAISVAIAVERFVYFRSRRGDVRVLAAELDAHLSTGDLRAALDALAAMHSVGAAVARAGVRLAARGPAAADKGMQSAMAVERKALEARLAFLGTLGNNAPFIGLFGTVIGVILAFDRLGQVSGVGGSQIASAAVMGAIAEALVATAVGIAVALPAVAAYNAFQRWIAALLDDAETLSNLVLAYLTSEGTDTATGAPADEHPTERGRRPVRAASEAA